MALKHLAAWVAAGVGLLLVIASAAAGTSRRWHRSQIALYSNFKTLHALTGWLLMWHNTLKDMGFFRELLGLNK